MILRKQTFAPEFSTALSMVLTVRFLWGYRDNVSFVHGAQITSLSARFAALQQWKAGAPGGRCPDSANLRLNRNEAIKNCNVSSYFNIVFPNCAT